MRERAVRAATTLKKLTSHMAYVRPLGGLPRGARHLLRLAARSNAAPSYASDRAWGTLPPLKATFGAPPRSAYHLQWPESTPIFVGVIPRAPAARAAARLRKLQCRVPREPGGPSRSGPGGAGVEQDADGSRVAQEPAPVVHRTVGGDRPCMIHLKSHYGFFLFAERGGRALFLRRPADEYFRRSVRRRSSSVGWITACCPRIDRLWSQSRRSHP